MIDELVALLPPPAVPLDADGDWDAVEPGVPSDYRAFVERYGRCVLNGDWSVYSPFGKPTLETRIGLTDTARDHREDYPEEFPYPLYPEPGGLLAWGESGRGELLCWLVEGAPDEWPVVLWDMRNSYYNVYHDGAVGLLLMLLREDGRKPWLDQPRELSYVTLTLRGLPLPYEQRLAALLDALAPTVHRDRYEDGNIRKEYFLAADEQWHITYTEGYDKQLRAAYPPADEPRARAALTAAVTAMGCRISAATDLDGAPVWR